MPIDVKCPDCSKRFRIPDKYAGKRVKCPGCQGPIAVPSGEGGGAAPAAPQTPSRPKKAPASPTSAKDTAAAKTAEWYLQTEDGEQYGPVTKEDLDAWAVEGRVDAACQLLRDGWEQWKWAEEVYSDLAGAGAVAATAAAEPENPFAGIGEPAPPAINPFESPAESPGVGVVTEPRGGDGAITPKVIQALVQTRPWVLLISILGIVLNGLVILLQLVMMAFGGVGAMIAGLPALAISGLYIYTAYLLFTYAQKIQILQRRKGTHDLEAALAAQKSFWQVVGIITLVALALGVLMIILVIALGGMMFSALSSGMPPG